MRHLARLASLTVLVRDALTRHIAATWNHAGAQRYLCVAVSGGRLPPGDARTLTASSISRPHYDSVGRLSYSLPPFGTSFCVATKDGRNLPHLALTVISSSKQHCRKRATFSLPPNVHRRLDAV